jgi:hypothetical protein
MQTMQPVMMVRRSRGRAKERAAARESQQRNKTQSAL